MAGRLYSSRRVALDLLPKGSTGVEVGVWAGDFSAQLLRVVRPSRLLLVDPWRFQPDGPYARSWYGGGRASSQADMDAVFDGVKRRFADQISAGQVEVRRAPSAEVAPSLADGSLDWVYIDGDHTHAAVLADLEGFAPKVRDGGLLTGDDYGRQGWWENGVTTAVMAFLRSNPVTVQCVYRGQFVLRKDARL